MMQEQCYETTDSGAAGRRNPSRKAPYIAPAVLAAVETADRPVVARFTGS